MENKLKIKQVQFFDEHFYEVEKEDGEKIYIPSVTTKLQASPKPYLGRWRGDIGNREADLRMSEAADRGSRLHQAYHLFKTDGAIIYQPIERPIHTKEEISLIENEFKGRLIILSSQDEMYQIYKLQRLYEILKPIVIQSEAIVYDLENMDAGQVDDIWYLEKGEYSISREPLIIEESGLYINDLKTGKEIDDDAFMQTSAYLKCAEKMGMGKILGTLITHTNAKSKTGIEGLGVYLRTLPEVEEDYADYQRISKIWQRKFGSLKPKIFTFPSLITRKIKGEHQNGNDTRSS